MGGPAPERALRARTGGLSQGEPIVRESMSEGALLLPLADAVLEHGGLVLEPIVPAHAHALWAELQAPALYTFTPHDPPATIEVLEARYARWAARRSPDGREVWLNYAIVRRDDRRYLGLVQATLQESGTTYLAYEVFPRTGAPAWHGARAPR